jgi:tRNA G10  N-methylase Trm11
MKNDDDICWGYGPANFSERLAELEAEKKMVAKILSKIEKLNSEEYEKFFKSDEDEKTEEPKEIKLEIKEKIGLTDAKYKILKSGNQITYGQFIEFLKTGDESFLAAFKQLLKDRAPNENDHFY